MFEFETEALAEGNRLCGDMVRGREVCEKEEHRERIVEVAQRIDEGRVTLLDDVV